MPFTPSILKEDFKKFIKDPKNLNAKFMSMAFNTTKIGQKNLGAAIHPSDYTARPQKLEKKDNNEYYNIVKEFKKLSGVGALLNTSLNLHGLPIVRTVQDAFYVFENSDLDGLVVESFFSLKKVKLVILTTETPHHTFFVRELAKEHNNLNVVCEYPKIIKYDYKVNHDYELRRDKYEKKIWFNDQHNKLEEYASVKRFDSINSIESYEYLKT